MKYFCCTKKRRNAVLNHPDLNGIEYLEVIDSQDGSIPDEERQKTLKIHFLKAIDPGSLSIEKLLIKGGKRIKDVKVVVGSVGTEDGEENILTVEVNKPGDFSTYTFCLVEDRNDQDSGVANGYDTFLSQIEFSFKVLCPSDFDCKEEPIPCDEKESAPVPEINYLAKDYASFKQIMLDRMSLLMPTWKERNPASIEMTLVELLAYTADYLSYRQDAISTEAYLGTARKRISVRRHARLVDYFMHDGCNARTWVHFHVSDTTSGVTLSKGEGASTTKLLTKVENLPLVISQGSSNFDEAINEGAIVYELMHDIKLYHEHNEMDFYTYGEEECCLPKGATEATLEGAFPNLAPNDLLVFSEVLGPETGEPQDANPNHRHVVRLTDVIISEDINVDLLLESTPISEKVEITKIKWHKEDALPFPLCTSSRGEEYWKTSKAYGNIALADHGLTIQDLEDSSLVPDTVPESENKYAVSSNGNHCNPESGIPIYPRYNPFLNQKPLTFSAPLKENDLELPASELMNWSLRDTLPSIHLDENDSDNEWHPKRDLLTDSASNDRHFVVEVETDETAYLRFGNNINGERPDKNIKFLSTYRIGNGKDGNIGRNTLAHIVTNDGFVITAMSDETTSKLWNPLPAQGGQEPESMEDVKQYAPEAFRTQERAVIAEDYETIAHKCNTDIQKITATYKWTGSWRTAFITADRLGGKEVDSAFERKLRKCLEKYKMAGFDLEVDAPIPVSLEIEMRICVNINFFKNDVKNVLREVFSNRRLPNGKLGIFHPDNLSFGQSIYLSALYAAAQEVEGVDSVEIMKFQRQGNASSCGLDACELKFGRREIARLDNNPNFPERGILNLNMVGGR